MPEETQHEDDKPEEIQVRDITIEDAMRILKEKLHEVNEECKRLEELIKQRQRCRHFW